jgi:hypothetical protein
MMRRKEHIKRQAEILKRLRIRISKQILEEINRSKDLFANYPREDGKKLTPKLHRGHEHGVLTNIKWIRCGFVGVVVSILHNFQDRRYSKQLTFLRERSLTWYLGKLLNQLFDVPRLEDGCIVYR